MAALVSPTISDHTMINDPSLQSTWYHRVWVATGCTTVLTSLFKSIVGAAKSRIWLGPMLACYIGYLVVDLMSSIYRWLIDNYGDASTPFFGDQIDGFQRHHKESLRITGFGFANRTHAFAQAVTFIVMPINILCDDPIVHGFVCVLPGCGLFSQQFHKWSHRTKKTLPPLPAWLQEVGMLVSRPQHAVHHKSPYNKSYWVVSGAWNKFLDDYNVFEALERFLFFLFGVPARSWNEPGSEVTENPS